MNGFFEGYGSLLFLAGIIGFMVWAHSRGRGCGMHGHGGHAHGENHDGYNSEQSTAEKAEAPNKKDYSKSGSCH